MNNDTNNNTSSAAIIPRPEHNISRASISENALKVLYRLKAAGYEGYLVGGGVRDLLLGREPKDFDIATDAHPDEVNDLFRNCRLIGRRFRLAHVHFGQEIIEVATFRGHHQDTDDPQIDDGMILRDNVYGTLEEDAWRRDFTVNSLYYNIRDFSVVDFTGGLEDIKAGVLRVIGDAEQRYREDPVRMLRAIRFAAKLGFRIHPDSEAPIFELGDRLQAVPPARLFDEMLKLFLTGYGVETFELLRHYNLFGHLFPLTEASLAKEENGFPHMLTIKGLANTDERIARGMPITPAFLFAVLLWDPVHERATLLQDTEGMQELQALQLAGDEIIAEANQHIAIPKRFSLQSREIWTMQARLPRHNGKRAARLIEMQRFRAAYDFLLLRVQSGEEEMRELADWWTAYQAAGEEQRAGLARAADGGDGKGTSRRRRRRRRPKGGGQGDSE